MKSSLTKHPETLTVFPPLQRMAVLVSALCVISTPSSRPTGRRINETDEIATRTT
jgi:hypothetical protein